VLHSAGRGSLPACGLSVFLNPSSLRTSSVRSEPPALPYRERGEQNLCSTGCGRWRREKDSEGGAEHLAEERGPLQRRVGPHALHRHVRARRAQEVHQLRVAAARGALQRRVPELATPTPRTLLKPLWVPWSRSKMKQATRTRSHLVLCVDIQPRLHQRLHLKEDASRRFPASAVCGQLGGPREPPLPAATTCALTSTPRPPARVVNGGRTLRVSESL
jgi:hypothetical protein